LRCERVQRTPITTRADFEQAAWWEFVRTDNMAVAWRAIQMIFVAAQISQAPN
ncbi:hypothetical protein H4R34_005455, partial [Dimargaris verticillata]